LTRVWAPLCILVRRVRSESDGKVYPAERTNKPIQTFSAASEPLRQRDHPRHLARKRCAMRGETTFIAVDFMIANTAIGADFTNARIYKERNIGVEAASMNNGENPFQYCRRVGTDDDPGDVPVSPAFAQVFSVRMTPTEIRHNSSFRCYSGRVVGCMVAANLNCGKAETSKTSRGGAESCRFHPNDVMIPMAATGHATIFSWRCSGDRAVPAKVISKVDDRGFIVINWKPLN
jgi:hypothetical protein